MSLGMPIASLIFVKTIQVTWAKATFLDDEDAQSALSQDRAQFIRRQDIMNKIPRLTRMNIHYYGDNGQISGFQELFEHLELEASTELRPLIVDYFAQEPSLRGHLSQLLSTVSLIWKLRHSISNTAEPRNSSSGQPRTEIQAQGQNGARAGGDRIGNPPPAYDHSPSPASPASDPHPSNEAQAQVASVQQIVLALGTDPGR